MNNDIIDKAFKEGKIVAKSLYDKLQRENAQKTIERFSYKFLEGLRREDNGDLAFNLIRLYSSLENKTIPEFFKELLKNISSMNQIGYAFLLGLNSYKESSENSSAQPEGEDNKESSEINVNQEEE